MRFASTRVTLLFLVVALGCAAGICPTVSQQEMIAVSDPAVAADERRSVDNNQFWDQAAFPLRVLAGSPRPSLETEAEGGTELCYPADKQQQVPLIFSSRTECPNPIPERGNTDDNPAGFPVTVTFPRGVEVKKVTAKLFAERVKKQIDCWTSAPDEPANKDYAEYQGTTIALIPKAALSPQTSYRVAVRGTVSGKDWAKEWTFRTGDPATRDSRDPKDNSKVEDALIKSLNYHRSQLKLAPVVYDEKLSVGCAKHALYLKLNLGKQEAQDLKAHNEDNRLPGFTDEGRKAGASSVICFNETRLERSIDTHIGTLYHRIPLLEPQLRRIGCSFVKLDNGKWITVIDIMSGIDREEEAALKARLRELEARIRELEQDLGPSRKELNRSENLLGLDKPDQRTSDSGPLSDNKPRKGNADPAIAKPLHFGYGIAKPGPYYGARE
jgi:hypothetical protein